MKHTVENTIFLTEHCCSQAWKIPNMLQLQLTPLFLTEGWFSLSLPLSLPPSLVQPLFFSPLCFFTPTHTKLQSSPQNTV